MIRVTPGAQVDVVAPFFASESDIRGFLLEKSPWLLEKLKFFRQKTQSQGDSQGIFLNKKWESGQEFLFLGKKYALSVDAIGESDQSSTQLHFDGTKWQAKTPVSLSEKQRHQQIKERFLVWYRMQAKEILGSRVFHFARLMGVSPKTISVKSPKRLWGSCNYRKQSINLNWQIIMSPLEVIDYVIVHELCHLNVPNHSKVFWSGVGKVLPDYQRQRQWLKENQKDMLLP